MPANTKTTIDFQRKIVKGISRFVSDRGYVTGDLPFIPELFRQNATFIPKATQEVDKVGMMGNELYRHLYVSFFGGIIATYFWYYARNSLSNRGLYAMCSELCPIDDLDKLSYGLMGMTVAEGEYDIKELFYEIYSYVSWELEEAGEMFGEETERKFADDLVKTFFHFGMWISLIKLGIHEKTKEE